jgi:acetyltransferase-like isoleucine patch superfamily enzyme
MNNIDYSNYKLKIQSRSFLKFLIGILPRFYNHFCAEINRKIAQLNGASIGKNTYITFGLALKSNKNLVVGNSTIIETSNLDLRNKITIGNHVIINKNATIIRASHKVDSKDFETISNELNINDFVWIATNAAVLPSCKEIANGVVIGAFSVVTKSILEEKIIIAGNPANLIRKRENVYSNLVVESLQGRDFDKYMKSRNNKL